MGDDELKEWQRERAARRKVSMEDVPQEVATETPLVKSEEPAAAPEDAAVPEAAPDNPEAVEPEEPKTPEKKSTVWIWILKGVVVFVLLRRVFMNAIASAESPSAYGAPPAADIAESILIVLIIIAFLMGKKKRVALVLGLYAAFLLIGSLIGFGIDANGKVWMALTAVILLGANWLIGVLSLWTKPIDTLAGKKDTQEISDEDIERLKEKPVR